VVLWCPSLLPGDVVNVDALGLFDASRWGVSNDKLDGSPESEATVLGRESSWLEF
jgi:hypothetical protein